MNTQELKSQISFLQDWMKRNQDNNLLEGFREYCEARIAGLKELSGEKHVTPETRREETIAAAPDRTAAPHTHGKNRKPEKKMKV